MLHLFIPDTALAFYRSLTTIHCSYVIIIIRGKTSNGRRAYKRDRFLLISYNPRF